MELDGVQQLDETTYYAPQDGGRITLTIAQPVADCETAFVVQGMQYTATSPLDAMSEEELSAMSAHDRRNLQKQYAHFWRKDSVYLRLLSNIGEGRIEYNRPNSQYYCGRHDFVYNFGTSDEPLQQITIVLPFAGYYQFDRLAVECQKLDTVVARAENLGAENLQNVTLGTNSLGGEITTTRSSVLVVQLPYSTGWSVTVDGPRRGAGTRQPYGGVYLQNARSYRGGSAQCGRSGAAGGHLGRADPAQKEKKAPQITSALLFKHHTL